MNETKPEPEDPRSGSGAHDRDPDIEEADLRNGEPAATEDTEHPTGEEQASKNRENDPPG